MRSILQFLAMFFIISNLAAQREHYISFEANNEYSKTVVTLDSVFVQNISRQKDTMLYAPFTLVLSDEGTNDISEIEKNIQKLKVFPNPFNENTKVELNISKQQDVSITIFDITGKISCSYNEFLQAGTHSFVFTASSNGIYFVNINGNVKKVVSLKSSTATKSTFELVSTQIASKKETTNNTKSLESNKFPYVEGNSLQFIGYATDYSATTIFDSPTYSKTYSFLMSEEYFSLTKHYMETKAPGFVNVVLSAYDKNKEGAALLTNENFVIKENDVEVSAITTHRFINKFDLINYQSNVALIIDNSSISADSLELVKNEAIEFINQKKYSDKYAIFVTSPHTTMIQDYSYTKTTLTSSIRSISVGSDEQEFFGSIIRGVNSFTDIYNPEYIEKGFVVLFSNNNDTIHTNTYNQLVNDKGNKNIIVIGRGNNIKTDTLNMIASDGRFFHIENIGELRAVFSKIQRDITKFFNSIYIVSYMSEKRTGTQVLKISVTPNNNTGNDSFIQGSFAANGFTDVDDGVYINVNENPNYGIDDVTLDTEASIKLKATTYGANTTPIYSWQVADTTIVKVVVDRFNAEVSLVSNGHLGQTSLTVTDVHNNFHKTISVQNNIQTPIIYFEANETLVGENGDVFFHDNSLNNPTSWYWSFGDNSHSTEQNPTHQYISSSEYTVTLIATNEFGSDTLVKTNYIIIDSAPVIIFSSSVTTSGVDSLISFYDHSLNAPTSWLWDFGDGFTSTEQNPIHSYATIGDYNVTLTATDAIRSVTLTKENFIRVLLVATDYDGNAYFTMQINNQIWMTSNLKTTHYADGTEIPLINDNANWGNLGGNDSEKAYCWYGDNINNKALYGALYTYAAATNGDNSGDNVQGACPNGWHIPSDTEWKELEMAVGMSQGEANNEDYRGTNEASKLAGNDTLWTNGALKTDTTFGSSKFDAFPAGTRYSSTGTFNNLGKNSYWWSSTSQSDARAWNRYLNYDDTRSNRYYFTKSYGFSIRCVMNQ